MMHPDRNERQWYILNIDAYGNIHRQASMSHNEGRLQSFVPIGNIRDPHLHIRVRNGRIHVIGLHTNEPDEKISRYALSYYAEAAQRYELQCNDCQRRQITLAEMTAILYVMIGAPTPAPAERV